jgi:hypothetical protein
MKYTRVQRVESPARWGSVDIQFLFHGQNLRVAMPVSAGLKMALQILVSTVRRSSASPT